MSLLMCWYKANKLSLNLGKTVLLKYWPDAMGFNIMIDGVEIKNEKYTKFLGIFIDDCLTWKEHANKVINRVHVNRKLLCNGKKLLNTKCLRNVYHAHIHSHLTYGLVVWGSMLNCKDSESIYKVQKQCIQTITNSAQRTHTDPLFKKLHILHFLDMIKTELAKLAFRVTNELLLSP